MKIKYAKPTITVVLMQGGQHLLSDSTKSDIQATIAGYDEDTDGGGFSQSE